jgi:hypothetical protein
MDGRDGRRRPGHHRHRDESVGGRVRRRGRSRSISRLPGRRRPDVINAIHTATQAVPAVHAQNQQIEQYINAHCGFTFQFA